MKRREFLQVAAVSTASAALAGCGGGPRAGQPPNVVFLFADSLRRDVCGAYGGKNIPTPGIDRLAAEGLVFDNALSTCPLCTPYRGMLMTGRYPTHSGIVINRVEVSSSQNRDCLAQLLASGGYDTAFLGKWHLAAGEQKHAERFAGDPAGMQEFIAQHPHLEFTPPGPGRLGFRHWEAYNYHTDYNDYWFYRDEPVQVRAAGYETAVQTEQAIAYMERCRRRGEAFLAVVAPHPPHPPFEPDNCPPGYLERTPRELVWPPNVPADHPWRAQTLSARCYYAMVSQLDDCIGRLLAYLDESGLSRTTLFVFTSDHGEMFASRGEEGKQTPYQESVGIPLVMRWPGVIAPGGRSDVLFTPLDHLPTLCGLAGLSAPQQADGRDLGEVLRGGRVERDAVLMMNYAGGWLNFRTGGPKPEWRGVRSMTHTYVKWLAGDEELYDDAADPYQLRNLIGDPAASEVAGRLRESLTTLLAAAHDEFLPGADYAAWYDGERNLVRTALGPVPAS